jgi:hypothetical protein
LQRLNISKLALDPSFIQLLISCFPQVKIVTNSAYSPGFK